MDCEWHIIAPSASYIIVFNVAYLELDPGPPSTPSENQQLDNSDERDIITTAQQRLQTGRFTPRSFQNRRQMFERCARNYVRIYDAHEKIISYGYQFCMLYTQPVDNVCVENRERADLWNLISSKCFDSSTFFIRHKHRPVSGGFAKVVFHISDEISSVPRGVRLEYSMLDAGGCFLNEKQL
jgi:hypothetical protein